MEIAELEELLEEYASLTQQTMTLGSRRSAALFHILLG